MSEWIKCSERMPDAGRVVLGFERYAEPEIVAVRLLDIPEFKGFIYADECLSEISPGGAVISHWQPLPPPPQD